MDNQKTVSYKIYCDRCNHLGHEKYLNYNDIKFRNSNSNKAISCTTYLCLKNVEKVITKTDNCFGITKIKSLFVDDPTILNKNNDCSFYEEKFYYTLLRYFKIIH